MLTVSFELDGQHLHGLNGGPAFRFTEAVSFVVRCERQEESDYYWAKLSDGGAEVQCGWVKDRFGRHGRLCPDALPTCSGIPRRCKP